MPNSTYFVQECPTCGRRLQIRVEYLGKKVVCQHCHAKLEARDSSDSDARGVSPSQRLLRRVDELLDVAALRQAGAPRTSPPR